MGRLRPGTRNRSVFEAAHIYMAAAYVRRIRVCLLSAQGGNGASAQAEAKPEMSTRSDGDLRSRPIGEGEAAMTAANAGLELAYSTQPSGIHGYSRIGHP